ncbi:hypothetical protein C8R46DRAFT_342835 [Mycena filopes]|nr:hypothetical protein C8R46DRAFT_342835 [Mycena filopes]
MTDSTPIEEPTAAAEGVPKTETDAPSTAAPISSTTADAASTAGPGTATAESTAGDGESAAVPVPATTASPTLAETPAEPAPTPAATATEPTAIPAEAPAPAPPREREMVADARLGVLRAMFPDFDDSLLQSVLDSVNGNTDRAIDALLGMSDPDYTSDVPTAQAQQAPMSQEALDEQLARTLMLEDQRQEHVWRAQQQQPPQHQQRPEARRRATGDTSGSAGSGGGDAMQEFTETVSKFAESGKKSIGALFSKVKAKIQEFGQPASGSGDPYGGNSDAYEASQSPYPAASRHAQTAQYQPRQTPAQQQVQQERAAMPAYYDPNGGVDGEEGYEVVGSPTPTTPAGGTTTAAPPTTNSGAPALDAGKLGMLPKRPVSLLRTNEPPVGGAPPSSDDEDALEYAESPFEREGGGGRR